ncbi:glycosyltransferase [Micromonospora profundi]|uniref:Glycosyltransferase n=1 Tax=Micromonospora profundi TaxID=1420889 RepID=A0AAJ6KYT6_9ACTN|nr:glycosyltransferase [Micromonospora profundi]WLS45944.1 glycosyltransferase [Micromonospora profundi]
MTSLDNVQPTVPPPASTPLLADRSVAVVHEWFGATGGSENVFLAIADLVPHARRIVLWADRDVEVDRLGLHETWLAKTPLRRSKALALPLMPLAWRTVGDERYDVVISSSHAFAHTVRLGPPERTRHLSYVHSPARYVWSPDFDGRGSGALLSGPRKALQSVDVRLSRHVQAYAANSREVQARIQRFWKRDAVVIHPPVDVEYFAEAPVQPARDYLLGVGRWIPYKNFDLMIEIAAESGLPLVVAGSGPEEARLRRLAATVGVPVTFEVRPSRERLRELYAGARALLFPAHEDFGIIPVEAQACGTPVIGLNTGGLLETVVNGETGFLIGSMRPADHAAAVRRVGELDAVRIRKHAMAFSPQRFQHEMGEWIAHETR